MRQTIKVTPRLLTLGAGRKNLPFIEMEKIGKETCSRKEEESSSGYKFKMPFGHITVPTGVGPGLYMRTVWRASSHVIRKIEDLWLNFFFQIALVRSF